MDGLGDDFLRGQGGNDSLWGEVGSDTLEGGSGSDYLYGGAGNDVVFGREGEGFLFSDSSDGIDLLNGGAGLDYAYVNRSLETQAISFSLGGSVTLLDGTVLTSIERVFFTAGSGDDRLTGGRYHDVLVGGAGNDTLVGGMGSDALAGDSGADMFDFVARPVATAMDSIRDFKVAEDTIRLDHLVFTGTAVGGLAATAFVNGSVALDQRDRVLYDATTGALWYDRDGSGAAVAVQFAQVTAGLGLTADDFSIL